MYRKLLSSREERSNVKHEISSKERGLLQGVWGGIKDHLVVWYCKSSFLINPSTFYVTIFLSYFESFNLCCNLTVLIKLMKGINKRFLVQSMLSIKPAESVSQPVSLTY